MLSHSKNGWTKLNPVLDAGVVGYEKDTQKLKVGDGETAWRTLGYVGKTGDLNLFGPFPVDFEDYASEAYLVEKVLFVPEVGMVVHDVLIDPATAVGFDGQDSGNFAIGQALVWDDENHWVKFDGTDPTAFAGFHPSYDTSTFEQKAVFVSSDDPVAAAWDPTDDTPTVPPTSGHYDFYFVVTWP